MLSAWVSLTACVVAAGVCLAGAVWTVAVVRPVRTRGTVVAVIACAGCLWGGYAGLHYLPTLTRIAGIPVQVRGTVGWVSTGAGGRTSIGVHVDGIQMNGVTYKTDQWVVVHRWTEVGATTGDPVLAVGTLAAPLASTEGADPSRRGMLQFIGTVEPVGQQDFRGQTVVTWAVRAGLPTQDSRLLAGLVFGDVGGLERTVHQDFLNAGLLHVLAASGANLLLLESLLTVVLLPARRWLRFPFGAWCLLHLIVAWAYTAACGFDVSILRAAWMASYRWLGRMFGRTPNTRNGLLAAACVMLTLEPQIALSVSAWLSFAATAAVDHALHGGRATRGVSSSPECRLWRTAARAFAVCRASVFVELWTLPVTLSVFHQWTPYSVVSNTLADPALAVLIPVCMAYVLILGVVNGVGLDSWWLTPLTWLVRQGIDGLRWYTACVASLPGALVAVNLPASVWLPYMAALAVLYLHPQALRVRRVAVNQSKRKHNVV